MLTAPQATLELEPTTPSESPATPTRRTRTPGQTQGEMLLRIETAIVNMLADADLQQRLARFGYTVEHLENIRATYQQVAARVHDQHVQEGAYRRVTLGFNASWQQAWATYRELSSLARYILDNDLGSQRALRINTRRPRRTGEQMAQARDFYNNALAYPDILARLEQGGIPKTDLIEAQQVLEQAIAANQERKRTRGVTQEQRLQRDTAYADLVRWYRRFIGMARVALAREPQWLEKLGITVPSR